jgi:predicted methyltransferase
MEMPHTFEDAAKWAERFDAPDRDGWQKPTEVVGLMAITPGMTVADLGAGTGYFLPHLAKAVGQEGKTLGLDIEPNLIQWMTERIRKEAIVGAEARLIGVDGPGLEAATVDRVLVVNTWHHIGNRDVYTPRLKTALKPGGMVVVVDYTLESEEGPPKEHRLAPEVVVGELEKAGFEASVAEETLPRQYVVVGRLPTSTP